MDDFKVTEEEIASIIYDTDIYQKIKMITENTDHEADNLIWTITVDINTHFSSYLERLKKPSQERKKYIIEHIESELSYYLIQAHQQKNKK